MGNWRNVQGEGESMLFASVISGKLCCLRVCVCLCVFVCVCVDIYIDISLANHLSIHTHTMVNDEPEKNCI